MWKLCARIRGLRIAVDVLLRWSAYRWSLKSVRRSAATGENALALKLEFIGTGLALCAALPLLGALFDFAKSYGDRKLCG